MSSSTRPIEVATGFITAFGNRDLAAIASYLADDVVFESPRVRLVGAEAVREAIGQFAQVVTKVDIIAALGDDEQAVVVYDMTTGPFGVLRAVDYLTIRAGKVAADQVIFDTYKIRMAEQAQGAPA